MSRPEYADPIVLSEIQEIVRRGRLNPSRARWRCALMLSISAIMGACLGSILP